MIYFYKVIKTVVTSLLSWAKTYLLKIAWASLVAQMIKNLPAMQETQVHSPGGRSPGEGNGDPLQYFFLENPMDRGAWWATICGVTKELDSA